MIDKLTAGMKSWIKQDYQNICESPAEYGIADLANEFGKIVDSIDFSNLLQMMTEVLTSSIAAYVRLLFELCKS